MSSWYKCFCRSTFYLFFIVGRSVNNKHQSPSFSVINFGNRIYLFNHHQKSHREHFYHLKNISYVFFQCLPWQKYHFWPSPSYSWKSYEFHHTVRVYVCVCILSANESISLNISEIYPCSCINWQTTPPFFLSLSGIWLYGYKQFVYLVIYLFLLMDIKTLLHKAM